MGRNTKLIVVIVSVAAVATLGALISTPEISAWYAGLVKPFFSPPNWLFGPVWTVLYLLMIVSGYLVWVRGEGSHDAKVGMALFYLQLLFNFLWSYTFFGLHQPILALAVIIALWLMIFFMSLKFWKVVSAAAYLQLPYLVWVAFAALLNLSVAVLN